MGVFAAEDIASGELIFQLTGRVITLEEVLAKGSQQANPVQIGTHTYIDVESPGVFINHSCEPNSGIVGDVRLLALRNITAGEQICMDYSTTMSEDLWTMKCLCGSAKCRDIVRDFDHLPPELKARYLHLNIVQAFIVAQQHGFLLAANG
jgi:SET domain-containing protein